MIYSTLRSRNPSLGQDYKSNPAEGRAQNQDLVVEEKKDEPDLQDCESPDKRQLYGI